MGVRSGRSGKKVRDLQTFTYFIPAPPNRKTGYREKEFDKIMSGILLSGFELVELKTESVSGGMYVLALLSPLTKKAREMDANLDIQDKFKLSHQHSSPDFILDEDDA